MNGSGRGGGSWGHLGKDRGEGAVGGAWGLGGVGLGDNEGLFLGETGKHRRLFRGVGAFGRESQSCWEDVWGLFGGVWGAGSCGSLEAPCGIWGLLVALRVLSGHLSQKAWGHQKGCLRGWLIARPEAWGGPRSCGESGDI